MRIGGLSSPHPITSTLVERTRHSCCCSKITTGVDFGGRRSWKGKGFNITINNNNGLGLHSSTRTTTRARRRIKSPYYSPWIAFTKKLFKDHIYGRRRGWGGWGGGDDDDDDDDDSDSDSDDDGPALPLMKFDEVMKEIENRGATANVFPLDVLEVVRKEGIRTDVLFHYLDLQEKGWLLAFLMRHCSFIRDRVLANPDFLVKLTTELAIYSCGTTLGEFQNRGKDFWPEFELYAADLFVGLLVKTVVFSLFAPLVPIGQQSFLGHLLQPILAFTTQFWDSKYTYLDPINMILHFVIQGAVGIVCGLIGQSIANEIMKAKRKMRKSNREVPVPPLIETAKYWGWYSGLSLGSRNHGVSMVGRFIESLELGKVAAVLAQASYISLKFKNDIYGGYEFVSRVRVRGIQ